MLLLHVLFLHFMFYRSSPFYVLSFASKSKTWQKWYTWETTMVQNAVTMPTFRLKELIQVFLFLKMPKILGLSDDAIKTEKKWTSSSPPFFLRDSRASETRARVKIAPREKRRHASVKHLSPPRLAFLAWDDFPDVKMPNFAFYGGRKQATTKFYFSFWALDMVPWNSALGGFAYNG